MKNSTNKPKGRTSIFESEMFWTAHPSIVASICMKYDWFKLERTEFIAKWTGDLLRTKNPERIKVVLPIVKAIWDDMGSYEKYDVLVLLTKGMHFSDSMNLLLDLNEIFGGRFLDSCIKTTYSLCTGRNWETNYLKAFGIEN